MKKTITFLSLVLVVALLVYCSGNKHEKEKFPYLNPDLSLQQRVDDLVSRMTIEEKVAQMVHESNAIERLQLPSYNWWNECLHGVARADIATVFPQAIALAATWNSELMLQTATVISDEARAKHHEFVRNGDRGIFKGLTFWSPNVNIFRDPRWGRGQETYGEDPFLSARMGVAFVKGLQGNDPKYIKVVATPKHFAVHSGPEPERHRFDAQTNERDLWDTYLPAFEATVKESGAWSVMCAYNRYMGEACCGSNKLLKEILRDKWGFKGYVVSDCDAIKDIYSDHKIVATPEESAALSVKAGCDLNCGDTYPYLLNAVKTGLITEAELDVSLKRLLEARFRLGMFDPPNRVAYTKIPYSVNDSKEHRELSIKVAQQSIVLLKNKNNALPLKKNLKTIAVIGPNANSSDVLLGNYNGTPSKYVTLLQGIKNKVGTDTKVVFAQGCNIADDSPLSEIIPATALSHNNKKGLKAEYFDNKNLAGTPLSTRTDATISSNWVKYPIDGIADTMFSVRWSGKLIPPITGEYFLVLNGDDGYRLLLNNEKVIDNWGDHAPESRKIKKTLEAGKEYDIVVEYYQGRGGANIQLEWSLPTKDPIMAAVELAKTADVIIFAGGISSGYEGEEMKVDYEGFDGGDRTDIQLPAVQEKLLKLLYATGKPVIFVLMNGSAMAINWADQNLPAIVEAWYPGQEGGTAIADVLFGDYNPAGRLPVTFYKSTNDLPPFDDYNMKGRTYRYFTGTPLYPFGYGLSYTTFKYSKLILKKEKIRTTETNNISVDVTNTGKLIGDEVVQLYVRDVESSVIRPTKDLRGFKRITLKPGETQTVTFDITPQSLWFYDLKKGDYVVEPGVFELMVGGSSADVQTLKLIVE